MYNNFKFTTNKKIARSILDNFSEEKEELSVEKDITSPVAELQEGEDIEFDENIDIDELQKAIQQQMDSANGAENPEQEQVENQSAELQEETILEEQPELETSQVEDPIVSEDLNIPAIIQNFSQEIDTKAKKYVIYVDPQNVPYIDNLSIDDRKTIINNILREQDELGKKRKQVAERNRFTRHAIVALLTAIISLPLLFFLVNKSLEVTMANYKQAQKNFMNLYRDKGKIQPN